jgi:hypothetical protein
VQDCGLVAAAHKHKGHAQYLSPLLGCQASRRLAAGSSVSDEPGIVAVTN